MPEQQRPPLAGLTSLRFFAACYVLLFHTRGGIWFRAGSTGVTLFFVLSGFILAYNHPTVPPGGKRRFYIARFARIYPLYFLSFLLMIVPFARYASVAYGARYTIGAAIMYLLVIHAWWPGYHWAINAGSWTLCVEAMCYALFPFAVVWMSRVQHRWKLAIALLYLAPIIPSALVTFFVHDNPPLQLLCYGLISLPVIHLGEFLIGVALGLRFLRVRPVFNGWTVLAALVFTLTALAAVGPVMAPHPELIINGMLALPYAALIYTIAGWKSRVLASPPLQLGGEISYGIYLLQGLFVDYIQILFHHTRRFLPLRFSLLLVMAYLCYRFIEKPARRAILNFFHVRSHPKPIETPDPATP